jgi:hypothetical protein
MSIAKARLAVCGLIVAGLGTCGPGDVQRSNFATPAFVDSWFAVHALVRRAVASVPIDCGEYREDFPAGTIGQTDASALAQSIACIDSARRNHAPFSMALGGMGIDTFGATGFFGTTDGSVRHFSICLGGFCGPALVTHECATPALDPRATGGARLVCTR